MHFEVKMVTAPWASPRPSLWVKIAEQLGGKPEGKRAAAVRLGRALEAAEASQRTPGSWEVWCTSGCS